MEPTDNRCLVLRTPTKGHCAVLDPEYGVVRCMGRELTAGTTDPARWAVLEECRCVVGRESTDGAELVEMVLTANQRDCELIHEEE